jgi:GntR family histidine utilization transcriptional repressor
MLEDSAVPLYARVKLHLKQIIESGSVGTGGRLPSEQELVRDLGVSRMTANRALRELAAEGYLTRVQGLGTFVLGVPVQSEVVQIRNIADEIRERGHQHGSQLLELRETQASAVVAQALGLATGGRVFHSIIVHSEDATPIQIEDRYVNPAVAPDYLEADFSRQTPNEYLVGIAPIGQAQHVIEAVKPDKKTARLLKIPADQPCLRVFRITWSRGVAGTCAWLTHPGHLYRMVAQFTPETAQKAAFLQAPRLAVVRAI